LSSFVTETYGYWHSHVSQEWFSEFSSVYVFSVNAVTTTCTSDAGVNKGDRFGPDVYTEKEDCKRWQYK
jgi:hypothetical protein